MTCNRELPQISITILKLITAMPFFMHVATAFISVIAWKQYGATKQSPSAVLIETDNLTLVMVIFNDHH